VPAASSAAGRGMARPHMRQSACMGKC
jgi:hypothetical protein